MNSLNDSMELAHKHTHTHTACNQFPAVHAKAFSSEAVIIHIKMHVPAG